MLISEEMQNPQLNTKQEGGKKEEVEKTKQHRLEESMYFSLSCRIQEVGFKCFVVVITSLIGVVPAATGESQLKLMRV